MMQILIKNILSIGDIPLKKPDYMEEKRWENLQHIKAEADKKRSLVSAYLLDYMCRELQIDNPVYEYSKRGKPILKDAECSFNLSHSGDYVVLAYHKGKEPVGVDIQKLRVMRDGMEKRLLHEKEKMMLPEEEELRLHYLNRLWTVKESFVKMTGVGLACDFRTIHADFQKGIINADNVEKVFFTLKDWNDDYYLSVCTPVLKDCKIEEI